MSGGTSYNGWPCSDDPAAIGVDTGWTADDGSTFPGGVKAGDVATVLGYVVNAIDARVEPLVPGWNWGWSYRANVNNPSSLSCHASATAVDYNAPDHPNGGSMYAGWTDAQVAEIRQILAEVHGSVQWGADYSGTKDSMHFEVIVDAAELARVAAALPGGGSDPDGEETVDQETIQAIAAAAADAVMDALEDRVFRSNFVAKDADGHNTVEDPRDANLFDTLGSANTNTTRVYLGKGQD